MTKLISIICVIASTSMAAANDSLDKQFAELTSSAAFQSEIEALEAKLTAQQKASVVGRFPPLISIGTTMVPWLGTQKPCTEAGYKVLLAKYPLAVLVSTHTKITLKSMVYNLQATSHYLKELSALASKGSLKNYPNLVRYLELYRKLTHGDADRFTRVDANTLKIAEQGDQEIKETMTRYKIPGEPIDFIRSASAVAPECVRQSGVSTLGKMIELDRMKVEGPKLLELIRLHQAKTGEIDSDFLFPQMRVDPIMTGRDAWQQKYLVKQNGNKVRLLSLGPDNIESLDDVAFGEFEMVRVAKATPPPLPSHEDLRRMILSQHNKQGAAAKSAPAGSFDIVGMIGKPRKVMTTAGEIQQVGVYFVSPQKEQKIKGPVTFNAGFEALAEDVSQPHKTKRVAASPVQGKFWLSIVPLKPGATFYESNAPRTRLEFAKASRSLVKSLIPGRYWIELYYQDSSPSSQSSGVGASVIFEVI